LSDRATQCNYQLYPILLDVDRLGMSRDEFMAALADRGVSSRLYYPPLHRMGVFAEIDPPGDEQFPAAVEFARRSLCLPIFAGMSQDEHQHVIEAVAEIVAAARSR
jgi:dTDP-4-amino-4,6-dideoxygalactose transaminase